MADAPKTIADDAEKAYAAAAAAVKPGKAEQTPAASAIAATTPAEAPLKVEKAPKPKAKVAARPAVTPAAMKAAKFAARPAVKAAASKKITPPKTTITELKEKIMATAKTTDFSKPITEAFGELQARAKAAYEKSTEAVGEATEFAKGNVEAFVESGKILAGGAQELSKTCVEEAKSAYEVFTADLKELATVKSPSELFQLQGKIARRNFDSLVATGAKNSEAMMKLANEAFAPISGRVNAAAEKLSKAA